MSDNVALLDVWYSLVRMASIIGQTLKTLLTGPSGAVNTSLLYYECRRCGEKRRTKQDHCADGDALHHVHASRTLPVPVVSHTRAS